MGIESRSEGSRYLEYDAIVFNKRSRNVGGFYEVIAPSAVRGANFNEWYAKKNHDVNFLLGSSEAGTATYQITDTAVRASVLIGDTTVWDDTLKEVTRRDLNHASFEFTVKPGGDTWERVQEDGKTILVRTVTQFDTIYDMSPVAFPAYKETMGISVAKRSMEKFLESEKTEATEPEPPVAEPQPWEVEIELLELESAV